MLFGRSLSNFIETPPKQHLKYFNVRSSILCSHLRSTYSPMTLWRHLRHQITCRPCILYLSNYLRVFAYLSPFCGGGCLFWWRCVQILERRLSARGMERWTKQTFKFRADRFTRRLRSPCSCPCNDDLVVVLAVGWYIDGDTLHRLSDIVTTSGPGQKKVIRWYFVTRR